MQLQQLPTKFEKALSFLDKSIYLLYGTFTLTKNIHLSFKLETV
jgi:hypothetical protein